MELHFNVKKKPCPCLKDSVDLTDDIKRYVLANRIYKKTEKTKEVKQIINNYNTYNTMNNIIANMDVVDKLQKYLEHKGHELVDFEASVENRYGRTAQQLDRDQMRYDYFLEDDGLLKMVEDVSKPNPRCSEPAMMHNVIYDDQYKELKIYDAGSWENMQMDTGTTHYIKVIQGVFLDSYERYLLRTLHTTKNFRQKALYEEMLKKYYEFIGCFGVAPYCKDAVDDDVLAPYKNDDVDGEDEYGASSCDSDMEDDDASLGRGQTTVIQETYYPFYTKTLNALPKSHVKKTIQQVQSMIKTNSKKNIKELNNRVTKLFHMDQTFKDVILSIRFPENAYAGI